MFSLRRSNSGASKSKSRSEKSSKPSSLTDGAIRAVADEDGWEDDDGKSEVRSKVSSRSSKKSQKRSRSRSRSRERSSQKDAGRRKDDRGKDKPSREERHDNRRAKGESSRYGTGTVNPVAPPASTTSYVQYGMTSKPDTAPVSAHVTSQFPGQFPTDFSHNAFGHSGITVAGGAYGLAAEYYGDQGQSVASQPGVRPPSPALKMQHPPHLQPASSVLTPTPDTGNGAAAEFYVSSAAPQGQTSPGNHMATPSSYVQPQPSGAGSFYSAVSQGPLNNGTYYAHPAHGDPQSQSAKPGVVPVAVAGGMAALAAGAHAHHGQSAHQSSPGFQASYAQSDQFTYRPPHNGDSMTSSFHRHTRRGPLDRLLDLVQNKEDVQKMEEYTEYIGVCKYCFDPRSSSREAPRPHHYHRRRSSDSFRRRRSNESLRQATGRKGKQKGVDKSARYSPSSSDSEGRRKGNLGWFGAGLAGYGLAKVGGTLWNKKREYDDPSTVSAGRRDKPPSYHSKGSDLSVGIVPSGRQFYPAPSSNPDALLVHHPEPRRQIHSPARDHIRPASRSSPHAGPSSRATYPRRYSRSRSRSRGRFDDQGRLGIDTRLRSPDSDGSRGKRRRDRKPKTKSKGFFNFSNGSSSSSDYESASWREGRRGGRSPRIRSRRDSRGQLNSTLLGIGTTAAALAAAQSRRKPDSGRPRVVQQRTSRRRASSNNASASEDGWESASDSQSSSGSSGLAFGDFHDDTRFSPRPTSTQTVEPRFVDPHSRYGYYKSQDDAHRRDYPLFDQARVSSASNVTLRTDAPSQKSAEAPSVTSSATKGPMQIVDPMPLQDSPSEASHPTDLRRSSPRVGAYRSSGAWNGSPSDDRGSYATERPDPPSSRRSKSSSVPSSPNIRDAALIGGAAAVAAGVYSMTKEKDKNNSVRFEKDEKRSRKHYDADRKSAEESRGRKEKEGKSNPEGARNRSRQEEAERRAYDRARENERQALEHQAEHQARYDMSGALPAIAGTEKDEPRWSESPTVINQRERELEALIAARTAELAHSMVEESNSPRPRPYSDINPDYQVPAQVEYGPPVGYYTQTFRPTRRDTDKDNYTQQTPENQLRYHDGSNQAPTSRETAEQVVDDLRAKYANYQPTQAEFFAPTDLERPSVLSEEEIREAKLKEWVPNADADIQYTMHANDFRALDPKPGNSVRADGVPPLGLIEPTPPTSMFGSVKGDRSPIIPEDEAARTSDYDVRVKSRDEKSANRVSWGPDATRIYEVEVPTHSPSHSVTNMTESSRTAAAEEDRGWISTYKFSDLPLATAAFVPDATTREEESPTNPARSSHSFYQSPFFETVSDLGFAVDSPGTEGAPPVQGFIEGEVDEPSPTLDKSTHMPGAFDEEVPSPAVPIARKPGSREASRDSQARSIAAAPNTSQLDESSRQQSSGEMDISTNRESRPQASSPDPGRSPEPPFRSGTESPKYRSERGTSDVADADFSRDKPLSKKDQKKRDKVSRRNTEEGTNPSDSPRATSETSEAMRPEESYFEAPLTKKEQRRREKLSRRNTEESVKADGPDHGPPSSITQDENANKTPDSHDFTIDRQTDKIDDDAFFDAPLTKKEKRRREKLSRQNTDEATNTVANTKNIDESSRPRAERETEPDNVSSRDSVSDKPRDYSDMNPEVPKGANRDEEVGDPWTRPLSRKEQKKRDKLAQQQAEIDISATGDPKPETMQDDWSPPLTRKEQKKRDKLARRATDEFEGSNGKDVFVDAVDDPDEWTPKLSKKEQKKLEKQKLKEADRKNDDQTASAAADQQAASKTSFGDAATALLAGGVVGAALKTVTDSTDRAERPKSSDSKHSRDKDYDNRYTKAVPGQYDDFPEDRRKERASEAADLDDTRSLASHRSERSSRSRGEKSDSSKKDKKGGILGLFRRKSEDSYSHRNDNMDDDERAERKQHRRRATGDDDQRRSTASSSGSRRSTADYGEPSYDHKQDRRKDRTPGDEGLPSARPVTEPAEPDKNPKQQNYAASDAHSTQDQSFLARRVENEELPSLPATSTTQPSRAPDLATSSSAANEVTSRAHCTTSERNAESPVSPNTTETSRRPIPLPVRPMSSTAVPIRFRRPPVSPLVGATSTPIVPRQRVGSMSSLSHPFSPDSPDSPASLITPRTRAHRPRSTEIRREFQPLYLVEHNRKNSHGGFDDDRLPPLPASREASRTSSVQGSDGYQSAVEEQAYIDAVETPLPDTGADDGPDALHDPQPQDQAEVASPSKRHGGDDILGSNQSTPRAAHFPGDVFAKRPKAEPEFYSWEDMLREEQARQRDREAGALSQSRASSPRPEQAVEISPSNAGTGLTTGLTSAALTGIAAIGAVDTLAATPESEPKAINQMEVAVPPAFAEPIEVSRDLAEPSRRKYENLPPDSGAVVKEDLSKAAKPSEQREPTFVLKSSKKDRKKKAKPLKLGTAVVTNVEPTRESAEEVRNREMQDTRDAMEDLLGEAPSPREQERRNSETSKTTSDPIENGPELPKHVSVSPNPTTDAQDLTSRGPGKESVEEQTINSAPPVGTALTTDKSDGIQSSTSDTAIKQDTSSPEAEKTSQSDPTTGQIESKDASPSFPEQSDKAEEAASPKSQIEHSGEEGPSNKQATISEESIRPNTNPPDVVGTNVKILADKDVEHTQAMEEPAGSKSRHSQDLSSLSKKELKKLKKQGKLSGASTAEPSEHTAASELTPEAQDPLEHGTPSKKALKSSEKGKLPDSIEEEPLAARDPGRDSKRARDTPDLSKLSKKDLKKLKKQGKLPEQDVKSKPGAEQQDIFPEMTPDVPDLGKMSKKDLKKLMKKGKLPREIPDEPEVPDTKKQIDPADIEDLDDAVQAAQGDSPFTAPEMNASVNIPDMSMSKKELKKLAKKQRNSNALLENETSRPEDIGDSSEKVLTTSARNIEDDNESGRTVNFDGKPITSEEYKSNLHDFEPRGIREDEAPDYATGRARSLIGASPEPEGVDTSDQANKHVVTDTSSSGLAQTDAPAPPQVERSSGNSHSRKDYWGITAAAVSGAAVASTAAAFKSSDRSASQKRDTERPNENEQHDFGPEEDQAADNNTQMNVLPEAEDVTDNMPSDPEEDTPETQETLPNMVKQRSEKSSESKTGKEKDKHTKSKKEKRKSATSTVLGWVMPGKSKSKGREEKKSERKSRGKSKVDESKSRPVEDSQLEEEETTGPTHILSANPDEGMIAKDKVHPSSVPAEQALWGSDDLVRGESERINPLQSDDQIAVASAAEAVIGAAATTDELPSESTLQPPASASLRDLDDHANNESPRPTGLHDLIKPIAGPTSEKVPLFETSKSLRESQPNAKVADVSEPDELKPARDYSSLWAAEDLARDESDRLLGVAEKPSASAPPESRSADQRLATDVPASDTDGTATTPKVPDDSTLSTTARPPTPAKRELDAKIDKAQQETPQSPPTGSAEKADSGSDPTNISAEHGQDSQPGTNLTVQSSKEAGHDDKARKDKSVGQELVAVSTSESEQKGPPQQPDPSVDLSNVIAEDVWATPVAKKRKGRKGKRAEAERMLASAEDEENDKTTATKATTGSVVEIKTQNFDAPVSTTPDTPGTKPSAEYGQGKDDPSLSGPSTLAVSHSEKATHQGESRASTSFEADKTTSSTEKEQIIANDGWAGFSMKMSKKDKRKQKKNLAQNDIDDTNYPKTDLVNVADSTDRPSITIEQSPDKSSGETPEPLQGPANVEESDSARPPALETQMVSEDLRDYMPKLVVNAEESPVEAIPSPERPLEQMVMPTDLRDGPSLHIDLAETSPQKSSAVPTPLGDWDIDPLLDSNIETPDELWAKMTKKKKGKKSKRSSAIGTPITAEPQIAADVKGVEANQSATTPIESGVQPPDSGKDLDQSGVGAAAPVIQIATSSPSIPGEPQAKNPSDDREPQSPIVELGITRMKESPPRDRDTDANQPFSHTPSESDRGVMGVDRLPLTSAPSELLENERQPLLSRTASTDTSGTRQKLEASSSIPVDAIDQVKSDETGPAEDSVSGPAESKIYEDEWSNSNKRMSKNERKKPGKQRQQNSRTSADKESDFPAERSKLATAPQVEPDASERSSDDKASAETLEVAKTNRLSRPLSKFDWAEEMDASNTFSHGEETPQMQSGSPTRLEEQYQTEAKTAPENQPANPPITAAEVMENTPQTEIREEESEFMPRKPSKKEKRKAKKKGQQIEADKSDQSKLEAGNTETRKNENQNVADTAGPSIPDAQNAPLSQSPHDIDFAATLAAGLAHSGFDSNVVTNDPIFHRRASPPVAASGSDPEEITAARNRNRSGSGPKLGPTGQREAEETGPSDISPSRKLAQGQIDRKSSPSNEDVHQRKQKDDFATALTAGLGAAGFSAALLNSAPADLADEEQPETSIFTTSKKKKKRKSKADSTPRYDVLEDEVAKRAIALAGEPTPPVKPDLSGQSQQGEPAAKAPTSIESNGQTPAAVEDIRDPAPDEWLFSKKRDKEEVQNASEEVSADDRGLLDPPLVDHFAAPSGIAGGSKNVVRDGAKVDGRADPMESRDYTQIRIDRPETEKDDTIPRKAMLHTSEVSQETPTLLPAPALLPRSMSPNPLADPDRQRFPVDETGPKPTWSFDTLDQGRNNASSESPTPPLNDQIENTRDSGYATVTDRSNRNSYEPPVQSSAISQTNASELGMEKASVASWEDWEATEKTPRPTVPPAPPDRRPSPVDSTTKIRTSYLFSSPGTKAMDSVSGPSVDTLASPELMTKADYTPAASSTRKRSKTKSDVGSPDHDVKTTRRTDTPKQSFRDRLDSNNGLTDLLGVGAGAALLATTPGQAQPLHPSTALEPGMAEKGPRSLRRSRSPDGGRTASITASIISNESVAPSLRRTDRSISGDLRAAARRGDSDLSRSSAAQTNNTNPTPPFRAPPTPPPNDDERNVEPRRRAMADDVFEGRGDRVAPSTSPTRAQSIRHKQSLYIADMEARLDGLVAENQRLQDARTGAGLDTGHGSSMTALQAQLREKDLEISQIRAMLDPLRQELETLKELNSNLSEANLNLVADTNDRYGTLQEEHAYANAQWQQSVRELEKLRHEHSQLSNGVETIVRQHIDAALEDKDTEISRLRAELEYATSEIRTLQARIQSSISDDYLTIRDEDYFDAACQKLCQQFQTWVLRFSKSSDNKACRLSSDIKDEKLETRLDNTMLDGSDVDNLLVDRVRRRDVFMALVMSMVWEYIFTRYLFGMDREQRQKLKALEKILLEVGPARAVAQWRATTLTLLSQRPAFSTQKSLDHEAVTQEIYSTLAALLPPPKNTEAQLSAGLKKVLRMAIDLSIEMRTQRADYFMLPPPMPEYDSNGDLIKKTRFEAATMNERSGEYESNEGLQSTGAFVKVVLFPLVMKKGDDIGEGGEETVICPAQVLVATSKHSKRVVRRGSGVMDVDDTTSRGTGARSRMSMVSGGDSVYM